MEATINLMTCALFRFEIFGSCVGNFVGTLNDVMPYKEPQNFTFYINPL